jgi:hypothetical protein
MVALPWQASTDHVINCLETIDDAVFPARKMGESALDACRKTGAPNVGASAAGNLVKAPRFQQIWC